MGHVLRSVIFVIVSNQKKELVLPYFARFFLFLPDIFNFVVVDFRVVSLCKTETKIYHLVSVIRQLILDLRLGSEIT